VAQAASGPGLPRAITPSLCEPAEIVVRPGGMSTSTQWKKSTRGRLAGTSRPSWLTSSPRLGTSRSWQISTNERVSDGAPSQCRSGLRLLDSAMWLAASGTAKANSPGIGAMSAKALLQSLMLVSLRSRVGRARRRG
jgi:hypothetical protein